MHNNFRYIQKPFISRPLFEISLVLFCLTNETQERLGQTCTLQMVKMKGTNSLFSSICRMLIEHASFDSDISAAIYMVFVPKLCYFKDAKLDDNTDAVISLLRQVT